MEQPKKLTGYLTKLPPRPFGMVRQCRSNMYTVSLQWVPIGCCIAWKMPFGHCCCKWVAVPGVQRQSRQTGQASHMTLTGTVRSHVLLAIAAVQIAVVNVAMVAASSGVQCNAIE